MKTQVEKNKRILKAIAVILLVGLGVTSNIHYNIVKENSYVKRFERNQIETKSDTTLCKTELEYTAKIIKSTFRYFNSRLR